MTFSDSDKELAKAFVIEQPSKTRKIRKIKDGIGIQDAILHAYRYIHDGNEEGYTRLEFPWNGCYFVVAKLKDNRDE